MDYKALIKKYCPNARFNAPATDAEIIFLEISLGRKLPEIYRNILQQFNGFQDSLGTKFLFSTEEAIIENDQFQNIAINFPDLYMDLASMYVFGAVGNGDYFFFPIINGKITDWKICRWDHENDSRMVVHYHFQNFIPKLFWDSSFVSNLSHTDEATGITIVCESNLRRMLAIDADGKLIWNEDVVGELPFNAFGSQPTPIELVVTGDRMTVTFTDGFQKSFSLHTGKPN